MFVELIEALRCPRPHEESPLVASASRSEARRIVDGVLGCPVCAAEFPISRGQAFFADPPMPARSAQPSMETAMRLAAFLELTDARGFAILAGSWGAHADHLGELSDAPLVLVNPPAGIYANAAAVIWTREAVPIAAGLARGAAIDDVAGAALTESLVRTVRTGGRVVAPAGLPLPPEITELVRDDAVWVGEKTAASSLAPRLVSITRGAR